MRGRITASDGRLFHNGVHCSVRAMNVSFRMIEKVDRGLMNNFLITFESQELISSLLLNFLRNITLRAHCIQAD